MVEVLRARTAPGPREESSACLMQSSFMLGPPPSDRTLMSTRYKPLPVHVDCLDGGPASALLETALPVRYFSSTIRSENSEHDIFCAIAVRSQWGRRRWAGRTFVLRQSVPQESYPCQPPTATPPYIQLPIVYRSIMTSLYEQLRLVHNRTRTPALLIQTAVTILPKTERWCRVSGLHHVVSVRAPPLGSSTAHVSRGLPRNRRNRWRNERHGFGNRSPVRSALRPSRLKKAARSNARPAGVCGVSSFRRAYGAVAWYTAAWQQKERARVDSKCRQQYLWGAGVVRGGRTVE